MKTSKTIKEDRNTEENWDQEQKAKDVQGDGNSGTLCFIDCLEPKWRVRLSHPTGLLLH